jgi:CheY-like chemotaxis protein
VRQFRPDLILLDVMMPGQDGGDIAAQLQRDPLTREIPVVFVTAAVRRDEVRSHQGRIGGSPFIGKPVELSELIRCIDQQLQNRPAATGGAEVPGHAGWSGPITRPVFEEPDHEQTANSDCG